MKKYFAFIALVSLTGCAAGPFNLARMFPDGASVRIINPQLTVSMTGAGSLSAGEISWTGTNGFPVPGTNTPPVKP